MPTAEQSLCITIDGEEIREGVPLQLLATVFMGVQSTIEDGEVVFELPDLHIVASGATREDAVEKLFSDSLGANDCRNAHLVGVDRRAVALQKPSLESSQGS